MKSTLFMLLTGLLVLTACSLPTPTPAPPTATPTITATITATPTLTLVPSPTSTPTPLPALLIASADKALANGDYLSARDNYQAALASSGERASQAEALFGLAKTNFLYQSYPAALESLRTLTLAHSDAKQAPEAYFLLGETYYSLERYQESADAYSKYLQLRPALLDAYVQEKRGDALYAISQYAEAAVAYQAALDAPGQLNPTGVKVKIANSYQNSGNAADALALYDEIYTASNNDYLKAQMYFLSGRSLIQLNQKDEAYSRWQFNTANYPLAYDSYSSLVGLLDANQTVDDFDRGLVDYYAGKYDVALVAMDRYIASHPDHNGSPLYYRGFILQALGEYKKAVESWDKFIASYPENQHWDSAWDERATTNWLHLDQYTLAAQSLLDYARLSPNSPSAIDYLMYAARIYERIDKLEESAALLESLPKRYQDDDSFGNALFLAGVVRYRQQKYPQALLDFKYAVKFAANSTDSARAQLWLGKTYEITGDHANAESAWQNAQLADASGYYSVRATDLLQKRLPFAAAPSTDLKYDLRAERATAAAWLRIKFKLKPDVDLNGLGTLASDPQFQRGTEFWQLGLYDQARTEFDAVRDAVQSDPADSFRLGNYLLDLGFYRPAIFAIRQVLTLAGMDDHAESLTAPAYFRHVRYGLYYADLVWPASAENELDPLFTTSLIRQESLFEGFVRSGAGARGLMQIIPDTGASIANSMGWPPNYTEDDLYSPYVSIRMGTFYINANRKLLNGDIYATLAAYNGGPGNAQAWQALANGDPDLFLEVVRFTETRNYIRGIYETYTVYRTLYSPTEGEK